MKHDDSMTSVGSAQKRVGDNFVAPMQMVQKTKQDMEYYKANPRPISAYKNKGGPSLKDDDDDYSDDNYEENEFDEGADAEEDLKLEKLRKAMAKENLKANKMQEKGLIKEKNKQLNLKAGPAIGPTMDMETLKNQFIP